MTKEIPVQIKDMFTGEIRDPRSKTEKRQDAKRDYERARQPIFDPPTIDELEVTANPQLPALSASGQPLKMMLEYQDPRTEEEKEHDRMKAAEAATYKLFDSEPPNAPATEIPSKSFPSGLRFELRMLMNSNGEEIVPAIQLDEGVKLPFWASRDEGYEWADTEIRKKGFTPHFAGDTQLELRKTDNSGSFVITYSQITESPVNMVVDVLWTNEVEF